MAKRITASFLLALLIAGCTGSGEDLASITEEDLLYGGFKGVIPGEEVSEMFDFHFAPEGAKTGQRRGNAQDSIVVSLQNSSFTRVVDLPGDSTGQSQRSAATEVHCETKHLVIMYPDGSIDWPPLFTWQVCETVGDDDELGGGGGGGTSNDDDENRPPDPTALLISSSSIWESYQGQTNGGRFIYYIYWSAKSETQATSIHQSNIIQSAVSAEVKRDNSEIWSEAIPYSGTTSSGFHTKTPIVVVNDVDTFVGIGEEEAVFSIESEHKGKVRNRWMNYWHERGPWHRMLHIIVRSCNGPACQ